MKTLSRLMLLCVVLCLVAFVASPYYKLYALKQAYDKGDYATIIGSVDFAALRPNIKEQLQNHVDDTIAQNLQIQSVAKVLGIDDGKLRNYALMFIDTAVDKAITTENFTALAQGDITKDSEAFLGGVAVVSGLVDTQKLITDFISTGDIDKAISNQKADIAKKALAMTGTPDKPQLAYCGLNCFRLSSQIKGKPITVIMQRHNLLDWKITNVLLPLP